jgi:hypothetical protein
MKYIFEGRSFTLLRLGGLIGGLWAGIIAGIGA